jgi:hypothetical protein
MDIVKEGQHTVRFSIATCSTISIDTDESLPLPPKGSFSLTVLMQDTYHLPSGKPREEAFVIPLEMNNRFLVPFKINMPQEN